MENEKKVQQLCCMHQSLQNKLNQIPIFDECIIWNASEISDEWKQLKRISINLRTEARQLLNVFKLLSW